MSYSIGLLLILTKSVLLSTVYTNNLDATGKIIGGHEATPNSHPYLVSLQLRFLWIRAHLCGGAILSDRWILTAAHCNVDSWLLRLLPIDAVAGAHDVNYFRPKAQVNTIGQRISHPLYEGGIGPYDIALFKTLSPFTFTNDIKAIKLPTNSNIKASHLSLAGWGVLKTTAFIPSLPSKLQEVQVTYVPFEECNHAINELLEGDETNPLDKEAHICSGPLTGGIAACEGDSGGPLVHYVPLAIDAPNDSVEDNTDLYDSDNYNCTNKVTDESIGNEDATEKITGRRKKGRKYVEELVPVVVGVVSWGVSPCGKKGALTVYTNVSNYLDFIDYFMNEQNYI